MCSLENFIICPSDEHEQFVQLSMVVLKLDRRDFEAGYNVDVAEHPVAKKIEGPPARVSGKGKKKAMEFEVALGEVAARPIHIGSDDDGPVQIRGCEAVGSQPPVTPQGATGSSSMLRQGHERGFSDSSLPDPSPPPKMKQVMGDSTESLLEKMMKMQERQAELHKQEVAEMLARERAERRADREEDRQAENRRWEMTTKMFESFAEMMPTLVAKSLENLQAKPLLMHDPTQTGQLLLPHRASHSSGSGEARQTSPVHSLSALPIGSTVSPAPASKTVLSRQSDSRTDNVPSPQNLINEDMDDHEEEEVIGTQAEAKEACESEPGSTP
jgi:hypothetical protein